MLELFSDLAEDSWDNVADLVVHRLGHAVTLSDCVAYLYDGTKDELVCFWATGGSTGRALRDKRMKRGDGVSGWVAANGRPMVNSPIALDLLATGSSDTGSAGHALSIPLLEGERLIGVFTIYRDDADSFSESDQQIVDSIAPGMAQLVARVRPFHGSTVPSTHDFPTAHHLDAFLRRRLFSGKNGPAETVLVVLQARGDGKHDDIAIEMAREAQQHLRGGDIVFVCDINTVVCLLASATAREALSICERLVHLIGQVPSIRSRRLQPCAATVTAPKDGANLAALLDAADKSLARAVA